VLKLFFANESLYGASTVKIVFVFSNV